MKRCHSESFWGLSSHPVHVPELLGTRMHLLIETRGFRNDILGEKLHYSPVGRGLCMKPSDSTKCTEAFSKAVRQPHVAPDGPHTRAVVHTAGAAGGILKNGYNTYGPLLFALAFEVLPIQLQHPCDVSKRANIYLLSRWWRS